MDFRQIKAAVEIQQRSMLGMPLFTAGVDKDLLWSTYLASFPEGTNPIFRERTEHDCSCCRQFVRAVGDMVAIGDSGEVISIWDVDTGDDDYNVVCKAMSSLVKQHPINNIFLHTEQHVGQDHSFEQTDGAPRQWDHFFIKLPANLVVKGADIGTRLAQSRSTYDVFKRGMEELTLESIETAIELTKQGSLYRGEEHLQALEAYKGFKKNYNNLGDDKEDTYCWLHAGRTSAAIARLRNTAIGTFLINLSEDMDLELAVNKYEAVVAPHNYKRPTALITKGMIQKAHKKVEELGLLSALERRFAVTEDITINNVLYADRSAKKAMGVFEELEENTPVKLKSLEKVEEVSIDTFMNNILPQASTIELLFDNRNVGNLFSLIAPVYGDAKLLFKWHNNFSWTYAGEVADSVKERVKRAGGNVTGDFRCSLSWYNYDDLDLHMVTPQQHIYHGNRETSNGGLDVDMNIGNNGSRSAVENITFRDRMKMPEGNYRVYVKNYTRRESIDVGFEVEIEFDGTIHKFGYAKAVAHKEDVQVIAFNYTRKDGMKIIESLPATTASKDVWSIPTQQFHKVKMIMLSPNYWDQKVQGNKHYFFVLEGCTNPDPARGFFNEFLNQDLAEHRKVFEILGSKMKTDYSDNQLSGLGFSSTQRNHAYVKVSGSFNRTIKVNF